MLRTSLIALAAAALASVGFAQQVRIYQDGRPEKIFKPVSGLDREDIQFLRQAAVANNFEIESSRIALNHGNGPWIHEFAKEMIDDHQNAQNEAVQTAEQRGVSLDQNMPIVLQHTLNKLHNLEGAAFDNAYRDAQEKGHEATIHAFKKEIENGHDQLVKAMAVKELPTIELHYKMLLTKKTQMGETKMGHGM